MIKFTKIYTTWVNFIHMNYTSINSVSKIQLAIIAWKSLFLVRSILLSHSYIFHQPLLHCPFDCYLNKIGQGCWGISVWKCLYSIHAFFTDLSLFTKISAFAGSDITHLIRNTLSHCSARNELRVSRRTTGNQLGGLVNFMSSFGIYTACKMGLREWSAVTY